jgi:hypothetical protein
LIIDAVGTGTGGMGGASFVSNFVITAPSTINRAWVRGASPGPSRSQRTVLTAKAKFPVWVFG